MRHRSLARLASLPFATAAVVVLTACGDSRLRALDVGISKDSLITLVGQGAPADDTLPNLYRHSQYFVDGKMFDVYYFDPKNRDIVVTPDVADQELTPLVVIDGKLAGSGWNYMDDVTDKHRIQARSTPR